MPAIRMYHPDLEPPGNECVALNKRQAAVYAEAGWKPAPEPEQKPGYEPEPVQYEPVKPKGKTTSTKSKAAKSDD